MLEESMFDAFEGYQEDWPGVYTPPERQIAPPKKEDIRIIDQLLARSKRSPDFRTLRLQKNIPVFVYDELKSSGKQAGILDESIYLGIGISATDLFTLKGPRIPVLLANNKKSSPDRGKIKGEVYAVSPDTLLKLDKVKVNNNLFRREKRTFYLTNQKFKTKDGEKVPSIQAWVYLGVPDCWEGDHLTTCARFAYAGAKDRKYFEFFPLSEYPYSQVG